MSIEGKDHFFTIYIFQVLFVLCFTRPRYQVSVYRTIGPLVIFKMTSVKFLNFWMPEKRCCTVPKIQTKGPNLRVFCQKVANGIANSENPEQTDPRSSLIWVCIVCPDLLDNYSNCSETLFANKRKNTLNLNFHTSKAKGRFFHWLRERSSW